MIGQTPRHRHRRDPGFLPHEIGRAAQIEATAEAVKAAMRDAGIDERRDVHWVQVKCPLLTAERVAGGAPRRPRAGDGKRLQVDGLFARRSALGVAVALGEIAAPVDDEAVLPGLVAVLRRRVDIRRASSCCNNIVIVLGNSAEAREIP